MHKQTIIILAFGVLTLGLSSDWYGAYVLATYAVFALIISLVCDKRHNIARFIAYVLMVMADIVRWHWLANKLCLFVINQDRKTGRYRRMHTL